MEHQYSKTPSISTVRIKLGSQLQYFEPKIHIQEIMIMPEDDLQQITETIKNDEEIPKFKSIQKMAEKIIVERKINPQKLRQMLHEDYIKKIKQSQQFIYKKKRDHHVLQLAITIIIWICYLISGLSNEIDTFGNYSIINLMGVLLASIYSSYFIIVYKKQIQVDIVLHLMSLILTIAIHNYKSQQGYILFVKLMWGVRNFRLLFIINYTYDLNYLLSFYSKKMVQIIKLMPSWVVLIIVMSCIMTNSSGFAYYNRCTTPIISLNEFPDSQYKICGMRATECEDGLTCNNPYSYGIKTNTNFSNSYQLGFGSFSYITLFHSFFTNMGSVFIANTSKIIGTYSNAIPPFYIVLINIIMIIFSTFYLFPIIVISLKRQIKQLSNQSSYIKQDPQNLYIQNENEQQKPNSSAITFGPQKSSENRSKLQIKKEIQEQQVTSSNLGGINPMEISYLGQTGNSKINGSSNFSSLNVTKSNQINQIKPAIVQKTKPTTLKCILCAFLIIVAIIHISLALSFSFKDEGNMTRNAIGIFLMVFFIFWTLSIIFAWAKIKQSKNKNDKNKQIMIKIETFIYMLHGLDYICKIILGLKIVESHSVFTSVATSSLIFRLVYLPYFYQIIMSKTKITTIFLHQVSTIITAIAIMIKYTFIVALLAIIVSSFTVLVTDRLLIDETIKYIKIVTNTNWVQDGNLFDMNSRMDFGWGMVLKAILIIIGEIFLLKMIFSQILGRMLLSKMQSNHPLDQLQTQQQPKQSQLLTTQQIVNLIKTEKSFNQIQFTNCIRTNLYDMVTSSNYKMGKLIFYIGYFFFAWLEAAYLEDDEVCCYIIFTMDIIMVIDQLFNIIALRFWGHGSYINYQYYKLTNFVASFLIIIVFSISRQLPIINFLRCFRLTILINYYDSFKKAYQQIVISFRLFCKNIIVIFVLWIFLSFIMILIHAHNPTEDQPFSWFKMDDSFRFLQKGFDLGQQVTIKQSGQRSTMSLIACLLYYIFGISLNAYFIGIILQHLKKQKQQAYYKDLLVFSKNFDLNIQKIQNFKKINGQFQLYLIKQQIISINPQVSPIKINAQSIFTKIIALKYYNPIKLVIVLISIFMTLTLLSGLGGTVQFQLKVIKIFCYLWQISFWIMESMSNNGTNPRFKLQLLIWIISFPGHVFMFIPFHMISNDSAILFHIFQFLGMVAPSPLTGIHGLIENNTCSRIINYMKKKLKITLNILLITFMLAIGFSTLMNIFIQSDSIYTFGIILIGMLGGTYQNHLPIEQDHNQIPLCILQVLIFLVGLVLRSTIFAYLIYECFHQSQQCFNFHRKSMEITSLTINNNIFDHDKFMGLWQNLDPEGLGILPSKTILNNIHQFSRCFNLAKQYIQFLIHPRSQFYHLKLSLFKKLSIPIRTYTFINKETNQTSNQYAIHIHDLISKFICFALEENVHLSKIQPKRLDDLKGATGYKNWVQQFQFENQEWQNQILAHWKKQNQKKRAAQQQDKKYYPLKPIEMYSWSLGIVLNLLPKLRYKFSLLKMNKSQ